MKKTSENKNRWVNYKRVEYWQKRKIVWVLWGISLVLFNLLMGMRGFILAGVFSKNLRLVREAGNQMIQVDHKDAGAYTLAQGVENSYETFPNQGAWLSADGKTAVVGMPVMEMVRLGLPLAVLAVLLGGVFWVMWRRLKNDLRYTVTGLKGWKTVSVVFTVVLAITIGDFMFWTMAFLDTHTFVMVLIIALAAAICATIIKTVISNIKNSRKELK